MKHVLYFLIYIGLALTMGCSKPDRSGEAEKLIDELTDLGFENLVDEAERLFLQCAEILMESTLHATDYGDIAPLIYTLLSLNDLYIDNKEFIDENMEMRDELRRYKEQLTV